MLNSNSMKDLVFLMMSRRIAEAGGGEEENAGGKLRYPDWMENWFYVQMTSEIRSEKGWVNTRKRRNESFDLTYYAMAIALRPVEGGVPYVHFGLDRISKTEPPIWFDEWDNNEFVFGGAGEQVVKPKGKKSFAELADKLA
jgi:phage terminase large subunit GpA-like protein